MWEIISIVTTCYKWKGNEQKHKHRWGLKGYTTEIQPHFKFRTSLAYTRCQSRSAPKLPGARAATSTKGVEIEGRRKTVDSELPLNKRQTGLTHTQDTTQRSQSTGGNIKEKHKANTPRNRATIYFPTRLGGNEFCPQVTKKRNIHEWRKRARDHKLPTRGRQGGALNY